MLRLADVLIDNKVYGLLEDSRQHGVEHLLEESTVDDVWIPYKGYGEDCYLYSYLIGIDNEITNILLIK